MKNMFCLVIHGKHSVEESGSSFIVSKTQKGIFLSLLLKFYFALISLTHIEYIDTDVCTLRVHTSEEQKK